MFHPSWPSKPYLPITYHKTARVLPRTMIEPHRYEPDRDNDEPICILCGLRADDEGKHPRRTR